MIDDDNEQNDLFDELSGADGAEEQVEETTAVKATGKKVSGKATAKPATKATAAKAKRTKIVLEENDHIPPTGLFIGHNGKGYLLKPGEEADVPDPVIAILKDAIISVPVLDPDTQQVVGYRNRMRYPFRYI